MKATPDRFSLPIKIQPQPTDTACGPACLAAIYRYWGMPQAAQETTEHFHELPGGGTMAVSLGVDALQRGMQVNLTSFNLQMFDPTWFAIGTRAAEPDFLIDRLQKQLDAKRGDCGLDWTRFSHATKAYVEFIRLGGVVDSQPLAPDLLINPLRSRVPVLCGLSATSLYREAREHVVGRANRPDDIAGYPQGHFVVVHGYDTARDEIEIADPLHDNPLSGDHHYHTSFLQFASALLLGVMTYNANLLVIRARENTETSDAK
ncbi:MAG: hypothetical protein AAF958_03100 [Planctomycetota bacterium]